MTRRRRILVALYAIALVSLTAALWRPFSWLAFVLLFYIVPVLLVRMWTGANWLLQNNGLCGWGWCMPSAWGWMFLGIFWPLALWLLATIIDRSATLVGRYRGKGGV